MVAQAKRPEGTTALLIHRFHDAPYRRRSVVFSVNQVRVEGRGESVEIEHGEILGVYVAVVLREAGRADIDIVSAERIRATTQRMIGISRERQSAASIGKDALNRVARVIEKGVVAAESSAFSMARQSAAMAS